MKKYIVANLKMNKNFDQFENYLENLNLQKNNNEIIICPSNILLLGSCPIATNKPPASSEIFSSFFMFFRMTF